MLFCDVCVELYVPTGERLGEGSAGSVQTYRNVLTDKEFAIKVCCSYSMLIVTSACCAVFFCTAFDFLLRDIFLVLSDLSLTLLHACD